MAATNLVTHRVRENGDNPHTSVSRGKSTNFRNETAEKTTQLQKHLCSMCKCG